MGTKKEISSFHISATQTMNTKTVLFNFYKVQRLDNLKKEK